MGVLSRTTVGLHQGGGTFSSRGGVVALVTSASGYLSMVSLLHDLVLANLSPQ